MNTIDNLLNDLRAYAEDFTITEKEYKRASIGVKLSNGKEAMLEHLRQNIIINRKNDILISQFHKYMENGEV